MKGLLQKAASLGSNHCYLGKNKTEKIYKNYKSKYFNGEKWGIWDSLQSSHDPSVYSPFCWTWYIHFKIKWSGSLLELYEELEWELGARVGIQWWEEAGINLEGAREAAVAATEKYWGEEWRRGSKGGLPVRSNRSKYTYRFLTN